MRKIFALVIIASFILTLFGSFAADAIDIYTFKKDRVDQEIEGNQGYISGKPADIPVKKRNLKRTIIGIDIELPSSFTGKEVEEEEAQPKKTSTRTQKKAKKKAKTEEQEWIK